MRTHWCEPSAASARHGASRMNRKRFPRGEPADTEQQEEREFYVDATAENMSNAG